MYSKNAISACLRVQPASNGCEEVERKASKNDGNESSLLNGKVHEAPDCHRNFIGDRGQIRVANPNELIGLLVWSSRILPPLV